MINIKYPTTDKEPPGVYTPVTYAYDLLSSQEKKAMLDECARLDAKGDNVIVWYYDTRGEPRDVQVEGERVSKKPSVWGEIWRESIR